MVVKFSAEKLNQMSDGMTLEQAHEIMEEAIAEGKIRTKSGRLQTEPLTYYPLRLFATGSTSHQFAGVRAGDSDEEDEKIRSAAWVLYRNTDPPASAQRQTKTNNANRRTAVSRGSQSKTVSFQMPESLDKYEAMKIAEQTIDQWLADFEEKKVTSAQEIALDAVKKLRALGLTAEVLAPTLRMSVEAVQALLDATDQEPEATEMPGEDEREETQEASAEDEEEGNDENEEEGEAETEQTEEQPARGGRRNR